MESLESSCVYLCLPGVLTSLLLIYILFLFFKWIYAEIKWAIWRNSPQDVVIIHGFPPAKNAPNASPFTLKLLTYLRMNEIPHEIDFNVFMIHGPKGRAPWITLNGKHMGDSELIIDFLNEKFVKNANEGFASEELALSTAVRVMLEEHAFWGMAIERFIYGGKNLKHVISRGFILDRVVRVLGYFEVKRKTGAQGLGIHSKNDVYNLTVKDLRAVSAILGQKKFILGDKPCQNDCSIFGHLYSFVWALPNSSYEKLIIDELPNLKEYCERMKERFFPDWDELSEKK